MAGTAVSDVLISDRGGGNVQRIPATGCRCNWEVSRAGSFSAFLPATEAHDAGLADPKGMWLRYEHPTAGAWGGQIVSDRWTDAEVELAAESFHTLLRKRRTPAHLRTITGQPGQIFRYLIMQAASDSPLWLAGISADEDGDLSTWEFRHDDLYDDVLPRLLRAGNHEWEIDEDRAARFLRRVGSDKSHQVHLAEGRHLASARIVGDLWSIESDLLATVPETSTESAATYQVEDSASIAQYGRRQGTRELRGLLDRTTVAATLRAELAAAKDAVQAVELTVLDVDDCWSWFREGDTVLVSLPTADTIVRARVMVRALDVDSGTMRVSADIDGIVT